MNLLRIAGFHYMAIYQYFGGSVQYPLHYPLGTLKSKGER
jgi:hypothetical protein